MVSTTSVLKLSFTPTVHLADASVQPDQQLDLWPDIMAELELLQGRGRLEVPPEVPPMVPPGRLHIQVGAWAPAPAMPWPGCRRAHSINFLRVART